MSIASTMENVRDNLKDMKRKYDFKKANQSRQEKAELTASLMKCRGQLEICKKDFNRTIKEQSRNIAEGRKIGADTLIQEQMLWDAALGYMLVKDAIYALGSVSSNDSISHAYEILDAAVNHMTGKTGPKFKLPLFGGNKKRNEYGYITSKEAVSQKEELLDGIFEKLKMTGDIEACLEAHRNPATTDAARQHATLNGSTSHLEDSSISADSLESLVNGLPDEKSSGFDLDSVDDTMMNDIHPRNN